MEIAEAREESAKRRKATKGLGSVGVGCWCLEVWDCCCSVGERDEVVEELELEAGSVRGLAVSASLSLSRSRLLPNMLDVDVWFRSARDGFEASRCCCGLVLMRRAASWSEKA